MLLYYLAWLGAPLGHTGIAILTSELVGALLLAILLTTTCYLLIKHRTVLLSGYYQWLIIAAFVLTTGASVSFGRSAFGLDQALSSRYNSFSLLLVPPLFLLVVLTRRLIVQGQNAEMRALSLAPISFMIGAGSALFLVSSLYGWMDAKSYGEERIRAGLAVEFATVIPDNPQLNLSIPNGAVIPPLCVALSPHLLPHLTSVGESISRFLGKGTASGDGRSGFFDAVTEVGDGHVLVSGWAFLRETEAPADGVLIVWKGDGGRVKPVSVLPVKGPRPDVAKFLATHSAMASGFTSAISNADIPGPGTLSAWAIDNKHANAYPLAGAFRIHGR
jgi:hypothetical protein